MDPGQYARVKEVFRAALRWPPDERAAAVDAVADGDTAVRDEVLSLLAHHDDAPLIREPPRHASDAGIAAPAPPPTAAPRVPGATLAERLRTERALGTAAWSIDRVVRVLAPVAAALADAAEGGAFHGRVDAAHIVVGAADGELTADLLGEFDAPTAAGPGDELAAAPLGDGAAASAAPEQILPALGPLGPWTDVYRLALLCVELMLGKPIGDGSPAAAISRARDEANPPTPRELGIDTPANVDAVLAMALAVRPIERYQDAGRFWTALSDSLASSQRAALPLPRRLPPAVRGPAMHSGTWWIFMVAVALAIAAAIRYCSACS